MSKSWFSREHGEVDAFNREWERQCRTHGLSIYSEMSRFCIDSFDVYIKRMDLSGNITNRLW